MMKRLLNLQKTKGSFIKMVLVLKFSFFLLIINTLNARSNPLNGQNIVVNVKDTEVKKILKKIENETGFRFLYNAGLQDLNKKVNFSSNNLSIQEGLNLLFNGTNLKYKLLQNNVVVVYADDEKNMAKIRITGQVSGENGEMLSGATVFEKGTSNGTTTDNTGNFILNVEQGATLIISYVGYETQQVKIGNEANAITIKMKVATRKGDEAIVIGYGTASRRDVTGSVAKIKGSDIAALPNTNPLASLQSKVSGLNIVNSAIPGSTPDVRIRGTISIGSIRPVYIIDGIFNDNMDFVNPSEIESIEVLKDPSSLAIFGIRGAAGAILVTTKKAKAGQTNINFNTSYGIKTLVDKIQLADGNEFRQLAALEANGDPSSPSYLSFVNNIGGPGMNAYNANTDWIDAVTRVAKVSTTNLSIDGSTEKNRFHLGLGYNYDEGLVNHVRYDRINLNLNDEYKVSRRFKIGMGLIGTKERLPYNSGALENARRSLPIVSATPVAIRSKNPYGVDSITQFLYENTPIIQNSETNPMATLENSWDKKIDDNYRIVGNVFADLNVTKDLNFRATWYADMSWRNNREYTPLYDLYEPTATIAANRVFNKNSLTAVRQDLINTRAFQQDYIATYKKRFNEHSLTATAGFTTYYNYYEQLSATVSQSTQGVNIIPNDKRFWYINSGFGDVKSIIGGNGMQREYSTVSGLARAMYNYKNKYFLNASFRRDGASQINREYSKKFQNFWALGGAWEISKESFMDNQKIFNSLKLKASTGVLGNFTAQGKAYPAYPTFSTNSSAVFGENLVPIYEPDYLFDPNLKWETVNAKEVGIEADFLNNKMHFEATYYNKKTENLIVLLTPSGILPTLTNNGSILNSGFEFNLGWNDVISKDLSYSVNGNLTTYKNKILHLEYPSRPNISSSEQTPNQTQTGFPIGYFYGLVHAGLYQSFADILASPVNTINGGGVKPGDIKYADLNGDGIIDDKDKKMIGNPTPDFTYGVSTNVKYKNFELSLDVMGTYGNEIYRVWGTSEQKNSVYNYPKYYTEGWTGEGSSNWVPVVNAAHLVNRAPSTYGIEDGSFFRIRNLGIAYNFKAIPKAAIKNLRLSFNVQNLKTWKRNLGYSPEFAGDALSFGMDFGGAGSALPRIVNFGLNVNF